MVLVESYDRGHRKRPRWRTRFQKISRAQLLSLMTILMKMWLLQHVIVLYLNCHQCALIHKWATVTRANRSRECVLLLCERKEILSIESALSLLGVDVQKTKTTCSYTRALIKESASTSNTPLWIFNYLCPRGPNTLHNVRKHHHRSLVHLINYTCN